MGLAIALRMGVESMPGSVPAAPFPTVANITDATVVLGIIEAHIRDVIVDASPFPRATLTREITPGRGGRLRVALSDPGDPTLPEFVLCIDTFGRRWTLPIRAYVHTLSGPATSDVISALIATNARAQGYLWRALADMVEYFAEAEWWRYEETLRIYASLGGRKGSDGR